MSKANPLAGLIGNYDDSDDDSDEGPSNGVSQAGRPGVTAMHSFSTSDASAAVHPPPIPHCPWSACYDEGSGFTYYWNQLTNAVTWEAPPEYLLALKLAQQQLHTGVSTEVSAEEWQLYQQALAKKQNSQNKVIARTVTKPVQKPDKKVLTKEKSKLNKKRSRSDDDEEKIELITSYHNSDSESEPESPVKIASPPKPPTKQVVKNHHKRPKTKPQVEFGPTLPPNQNYPHPIGPEIPPELLTSPKLPVIIDHAVKIEEKKPVKIVDTEENQDENILLRKLKDKAKILEKLGGQIPSDLQQLIGDGKQSNPASVIASPTLHPELNKDPKLLTDNIDELLEEIEKKELPKIAKTKKMDIFDDTANSAGNSPKGDMTPPVEPKPLFPSVKNIFDVPSLFPSAVNVQEDPEKETKNDIGTLVAEKKGANVYLMDANEPIENTNRKKLRISNSVLPERKKSEVPSYTTKYANSIEGFAADRTGLGFSKDAEEEVEAPKSTVNYGNGLMFTKGETLNEDKKDEDLDDLTDLVEAKLKYLSQLQPCVVTPVQEMLIQMQTLASAFRAGSLGAGYWRCWAAAAAGGLRAHEAAAAPPGWCCSFQRSEGRYRYRRESDGLVQWEYPAAAHMDMDISTTPPHPGTDDKEEVPAPPLPPLPPPSPPPPEARSPPPPPPPGASPTAPAPKAPPAAARRRPPAHRRDPPPPPPGASPPPPAPPAPRWARAPTPPPPAWPDPPPPGCGDLLPAREEPKCNDDELLSFYNDIAQLEQHTSDPNTASNSPEPPPLPSHSPEVKERDRHRERDRDMEREDKKDTVKSSKKSKVKISAAMGLKHKSVSNLVAKWQQVAEENDSD